MNTPTPAATPVASVSAFTGASPAALAAAAAARPPAAAWRRLLLPLGLLAGVALLLAAGLRQDPRALPSALIGRPVPALALPSLHDGRSGLDLRPGGLHGPYVLHVWASWCAPCREEQPVLMALARQHPRWTLAGIAYKDAPAQARAFLTRLGDPYTAIGQDSDGRAAMELGVYGVPETFVVDARGRITWRHAGPLDAAARTELEARMEAAR
ncbi:MAG: thiol:disulfide interchange protein [Pseudomonadota bacterium]|jgi:cytochrome c biogenesis protein CcmG/thiol:disulfide interchange protein DsbE